MDTNLHRRKLRCKWRQNGLCTVRKTAILCTEQPHPWLAAVTRVQICFHTHTSD